LSFIFKKRKEFKLNVVLNQPEEIAVGATQNELG
jgi:hypothetical protein